MKRFLIALPVVLAVMLLLASCSPASYSPSPTAADTPYEMKAQYESDNFDIKYFGIYYGEADKECMYKIAQSLEDGRLRMAEIYGVTFEEKKQVEIHRGLSELHIAMGMPDAPDWAVGGYSFGKILTLSPLVEAPYTDYDSLLRSPFHEYVHHVIFAINPATPRWLNEGISFYESRDHSMAWVASTVKQSAMDGEMPPLSHFDTGNDYQTFADHGGYQYMYSLVDFIVSDFGYANLIELIKSPYDFDGVFSLTEEELWDMWTEFVAERYGD